MRGSVKNYAVGYNRKSSTSHFSQQSDYIWIILIILTERQKSCFFVVAILILIAARRDRAAAEQQQSSSRAAAEQQAAESSSREQQQRKCSSISDLGRYFYLYYFYCTRDITDCSRVFLKFFIKTSIISRLQSQCRAKQSKACCTLR